EHGLNALPLIWQVQALHTLMPHPYFGPVTPRRSRSTHSNRTSFSASTVTCSPLSLNVCLGMNTPCVCRNGRVCPTGANPAGSSTCDPAHRWAIAEWTARGEAVRTSADHRD